MVSNTRGTSDPNGGQLALGPQVRGGQLALGPQVRGDISPGGTAGTPTPVPRCWSVYRPAFPPASCSAGMLVYCCPLLRIVMFDHYLAATCDSGAII